MFHLAWPVLFTIVKDQFLFVSLNIVWINAVIQLGWIIMEAKQMHKNPSLVIFLVLRIQWADYSQNYYQSYIHVESQFMYLLWTGYHL